ncbi:hypothetical protein Q31a_48910 [Aureliella helgolandensis]|uniref:Uncharacterized protein n=1 Tax=Aureliella helgolandensis TaxID=2527968 RepID=A0A518GD74_9BACT|nr:hypothetical protein Q31a_48910 [Aureliella helgolandensis]
MSKPELGDISEQRISTRLMLDMTCSLFRTGRLPSTPCSFREQQ